MAVSSATAKRHLKLIEYQIRAAWDVASNCESGPVKLQAMKNHRDLCNQAEHLKMILQCSPEQMKADG